MFFEAASIVALVEPLGEVVMSEQPDEKTDLIVLKGVFSSGDNSYKFELKSDGTGEIFYSDFPTDSEEFAHEIKVEKLAAEIEEAIREQIVLQSEENAPEDAEIENIREEISGEMLEEVFWEEINQTLEDPFFRSFYALTNALSVEMCISERRLRREIAACFLLSNSASSSWLMSSALRSSANRLKELLNFLIYGRHAELLTEHARGQPALSLTKIPATTKELKDALKARRLDKDGKLFFDCSESDHHIAVLLDNYGAQFWIHYFRCGIGLVNLSFFSYLATAESSLTNQTRNVTHSSLEYQWFTHDLSAQFFYREIDETTIKRFGDYFIEKVNPTLVYPYSIYSENPKIKELYKFVSGSLEQLTEVLTWTRFVCEGLKRDEDPNGKTYVSPHVTINCGNLKDAPTFERSTETFINVLGALAVKENAPYTVLREGYGRRAGGESFDSARKNKHRIFLNLEQNKREVPVREKIAARTRLVDWLREQGAEGERVSSIWKI